MAAWTHDALIADLVSWLRRSGCAEFLAAEARFGRAYYVNSPIPDVVRIRRSYTRVDCSIYEIKVSRQDFLAELRSDKWRDYLPRSSRLYFATPADGVVADKREIPDQVGWFVRAERGWHVRQAPRVRQFELHWEEALALAMYEHDRAQAAEMEVERVRALRRAGDRRWSRRMVQRVVACERVLGQGRGLRTQLREAARELEQITGINLRGYGWVGDLREWAASRASCLPDEETGKVAQKAQELAWAVQQLRQRVVRQAERTPVCPQSADGAQEQDAQEQETKQC